MHVTKTILEGMGMSQTVKNCLERKNVDIFIQGLRDILNQTGGTARTDLSNKACERWRKAPPSSRVK